MPGSKLKKPRLLLHVCCGVCAAYVCRILKADFSVELFFYNPNIFPENEYFKRLNEAEKIAKIHDLNIITGDYKHDAWLKAVGGHENDKEGGKRCEICFAYRLRKTAELAAKKNYDYFTTTLSVSPRKKSEIISGIGNNSAKKYKAAYLDKNFKKRDGFKKTIELSKNFNLYRQNYCGCEFSVRKKL